MLPAIIVSGHTMGLGVARALGERGVPVRMFHHDERDMAHVSRYVERAIRVPHPEKEEQAFIQRLLERPLGPGVLIPTSDEAVVALSKHKAQLEACYTVACSDWHVTQRFIDKHQTYEYAAQAGVAAPRTLMPAHRDEVRAYASVCDFPCLVKPCQSHLYYDRFGTKMKYVESPEDMLCAYEEAELAGLKIMLQEFIPGGDAEVVNYNAYVRGGVPLVEFTAAHVRNAPPWFGSPRVAVSRRIPEVVEPGRKILAAIGFNGYACTEFKRDPRDGRYKLMEVNGRHNLSTRLAVACGVNFPWIHYADITGAELPVASDSCREGVYWVDLLRDVAYSAVYARKERYSLKEYLAPYRKGRYFAILDGRDLRPFFLRVWKLGITAVRNGLARWRQSMSFDRTDKRPPLTREQKS